MNKLIKWQNTKASQIKANEKALKRIATIMLVFLIGLVILSRFIRGNPIIELLGKSLGAVTAIINLSLLWEHLVHWNEKDIG